MTHYSPLSDTILFLCPQTPVHLAVITSQHAVLDLFLQRSINLTIVDNSGNTALHLACIKHNMTALGVLCSYVKEKDKCVSNILNYQGVTL